MEIKNLTNTQLLEHFKDAVADHHYSPFAESLNKSGFSLDELEKEILQRMDVKLPVMHPALGWLTLTS